MQSHPLIEGATDVDFGVNAADIYNNYAALMNVLSMSQRLFC